MKRLNSKATLSKMLGELPTLQEERLASQFLTLLDRVLNASASSKQWALGEKAVEQSRSAWSSGLFTADDLFLLIRHVSNYYMTAANHDAVISLYLQAVDHFADFDAFQPAYRLLHDAEIYAAEHCDVHNNLRVKDRCAEICITEGDLDYATKILRSLRKLRRRFGLETPIGLEMNYGNLQLRKEHYGPALKTLRRGLDSKHPAYLRLPCLLNSSICLRELGDFTKAEQCLAGARALCDETTETSQLVELDLVEAKTCIAVGQSMRAADCLRNAVQLIDTLLLSAGRLHYRRGIRERYRSRVVHLLYGLPQRGETQSILSLIAFIKGNSSSDWLALLDWRTSLPTSCIPKELAGRFEKALAGIAAAGAPVLYGYREKYDEPWSTPWTTDEETFSSVSFTPTIPWAELNAAITEICTITGQERPWDAASSERRSGELLQAMGQSGRILAQTLTSSSASLYLISGDQYERIDLPMQNVSKLSVLFAMHKAGKESARDFRERLTLFTNDLAGLLSAPLDSACASGFDSLSNVTGGYSSHLTVLDLASVDDRTSSYGEPVAAVPDLPRAAVVAATWATFDSAAYIFAQLFYTAIANKADAQIAFAQASAALHDMDVAAVHKSLESVDPPELGVEKQAVFRGAGRPFSHPYVAGNYRLLCLLPPAKPA